MTDAERLVILETAMRKLQVLSGQTYRRSTLGQLKLFESEVMGIIDRPEVNKAMGIEAPADDFEAVERILGKPLVVEFPDEPTSSEDAEPFDPRKGWEDR